MYVLWIVGQSIILFSHSSAEERFLTEWQPFTPTSQGNEVLKLARNEVVRWN